ncbi:Acg family FMN-binding oxidoreductase [Ramlibacter rhizophilus]|uniref:Nitroreductase n=1 Tax=Ramlibacter rhizophilus TaxID=1781167 RepID=A0A4Z0BY98_9BURK|nr:nitroreductase [Ramlibacter rhizophilus]TFZ03494.1 nitroreductase [Ramlibacter rhizophilus]
MARDPEAEWRIDPSDYPASGSAAQRLRFLLRYAILAPSSHNTQPWLFRLAGDELELLADRRRALPVVDPHDRALVISCGAALGLLQVAMRRFGHAGDIELLPPGDADRLARVRLGPPHAATDTDRLRFEAIAARRTTRKAFASEPLPAGLAEDLHEIARLHGTQAALVTAHEDKAAIAALVARGDRAQFADPSFRRELGAWVHSRRAASRDGISGANFGMPDLMSALGGLVVRTFDMGGGVAAKDEQIATASPALLVVATTQDTPRDWLAAGASHAQMLLAITAAGLTAAYLNQPIEVSELRPALREAAGTAGAPQLLLRLGRGPRIPPAVRRPVAEVLLED